MEEEEEEEEEETKEEETKEEEEATDGRTWSLGLKRIDRVSRWIDFLRNRMVSIYDGAKCRTTEGESGGASAETKTPDY